MVLSWGAYGLGGHMVRRLLPALRAAKGSELVAVGHHKPDVAKSVAKEWGVRNHYASIGELVQNSELDAIVVATPNDLHHEHGLAALNAGKHLLLEKPMTLEARHAAELVDTAKKRGLILGVGFHLRHHPVLCEMSHRIAAGDIGEPLYLQASFGRAHPWPQGIWWSDTKRSGPQVLMGYGVHVLDLCRWMLKTDFVSTYSTMLWEPVNTFTTIHLDMGTGARCSLMCSTAIKYIPNTIEVMGRNGRLVGAGAVTTTDAGHLMRSTGAKIEMIDVAPKDPYIAQFEAFAEAADGGKPFHADGTDGLKVVCAQEAIIESAEKGRAVTIN